MGGTCGVGTQMFFLFGDVLSQPEAWNRKLPIWLLKKHIACQAMFSGVFQCVGKPAKLLGGPWLKIAMKLFVFCEFKHLH